MSETRYDEHINFSEGLPFILHRGITVTPKKFTPEANWHEDIELQFCEEGDGTFRADSVSYALCRKRVAVANSNVIHHTSSESSLTYSCLIIDSRFCREIGIDPAVTEFEAVFESECLYSLFKELTDIYSDTADPCRTAGLYGAAIKILVFLRKNHTLSEKSERLKDASLECVKKTIRFIRENYNRKLQLCELAKVALTDKYTLSREFKRVTGFTVVQYINRYRCKCAAEHISKGMRVSDAAEMCGFSNMSFFTKTFLAHMGHLPSKTEEV